MEKLIRTLFRINVVLGIIIIILVALMMRTAKADVGDAQKFQHIPMKLHRAGVIRIMVIDTGIDFGHPLLRSYIDQYDVIKHVDQYVDDWPHGTHIAGLILYGPMPNAKRLNIKDGVCEEVQITSCKYTSRNWKDQRDSLYNEIACLNRAYDEDFDVVNYSSYGPDFIQKEYEAIKKLHDKGILLVTSAGNTHLNLKDFPFYPSGYAFPTKGAITMDNVIPVGAASNSLAEAPYSNHGQIMPMEISEGEVSTLPNNSYGPMHGTSQAAAIHLHRLLVEKCKELDNLKLTK
jgi:hypothetical protein